MSRPSPLEFLLVSSDYKTLTAVTGGLKQFGASLSFVPTSESARDFIGRRKLDGIFVDLEVAGALELIRGIRAGSSNKLAMIFACIAGAKETTATLVAGANFLVQQPVTAETIVSHVSAAKDMMDRERRRYFRHPLNLPVSIKAGGAEQRAKMINLGDGGMAVRLAKPVTHSLLLDFDFELPMGQPLSGKGVAAWANSEGLAGIRFQFFRGKGREQLQEWLSAQHNIAANRPAPSE